MLTHTDNGQCLFWWSSITSSTYTCCTCHGSCFIIHVSVDCCMLCQHIWYSSRIAAATGSLLFSSCSKTAICHCSGGLQGSVGTIARGHEASVRIAVQGHHAAAAAARLPVTTLSQMLKSALSVELDTQHVSQRLMRLIKTDRWHVKAEQILKTARPTGAVTLLKAFAWCPLCCDVVRSWLHVACPCRITTIELSLS